MLKKYKSKLLSIFSISMLATIPIVMTSCGSTTNSTGNSTIEKPENGVIPNPSEPSLKGDETNKESFAPSTTNGIYANITKNLISSFHWETNNTISNSISEYKNDKIEDIKDIIKMWSFNKWFSTKNVGIISIPIESNLLNFSASKNNNSNWNVSFDYVFKLTIKQNGKEAKIYAKKNYSSSNFSLKANLLFETKPIEIKVNGYDVLNIQNSTQHPANDALNLDAVKRFLAFLKLESSSLSSNDILNEFFKNKNIWGDLGIWNNSVNIVNGVSINDDRTKINVDFSKFQNDTTWYGLGKNSTLENIKNIVYKTKNKNNKEDLSDEFKKLIKNEQGLIKNFKVSETIGETVKFNIHLSKENGSSGFLTIEFINYKNN